MIGPTVVDFCLVYLHAEPCPFWCSLVNILNKPSTSFVQLWLVGPIMMRWKFGSNQTYSLEMKKRWKICFSKKKKKQKSINCTSMLAWFFPAPRVIAWEALAHNFQLFCKYCVNNNINNNKKHKLNVCPFRIWSLIMCHVNWYLRLNMWRQL